MYNYYSLPIVAGALFDSIVYLRIQYFAKNYFKAIYIRSICCRISYSNILLPCYTCVFCNHLLVCVAQFLE
jgi:hypothetical protein